MSSKAYGIEAARKILGDLALEVRRTGQDIVLTRGNSRTPIARITPLEATMTTTTTSYGNFHTHCADARTSLTPHDYVMGALGDFGGDYDVDALVEDFRAAINAQLEGTGVTMNGELFYGPHPKIDVDISAAIEAVDFWAIAGKHDTTASESAPMTETTIFGTWHSHSPFDGQTIAADIRTATNGGTEEWHERMEDEGRFDRIEEDYREAIAAALPSGVWLVGTDVYGPANDEREYDLDALIATVDLGEIIDRHSV